LLAEDPELTYVKLQRQGVCYDKEYTYKCSGAIYKGDWLGGFRHGNGTMRWIDGTTFEGKWIYGQPYSRGKITYASGETYVGQWANSKRNGFGTSTMGHATYTGEWRDGFKHGRGKEIFTDAS
jgi:hypothetical protein